MAVPFEKKKREGHVGGGQKRKKKCVELVKPRQDPRKDTG